MTNAQHIAYLLYRQLEGTIDPGEGEELSSWRKENPGQEELFEQITSEEGMNTIINRYEPENKKAVEREIWSQIETEISFRTLAVYRRFRWKLAVAASVALLILAGSYYIFFNKPSTSNPPVAIMQDVKAPAGTKARITLADGRVIAVDSLNTYLQGSVKVTKTADGKIIYTGFGDQVEFNTLSNPRGSKVIDITMVDGSHIWLNAGSTLRYPTAFTGSEREVTITGEAYFEVAHDKSKPFLVRKGNMKVQVYGTKFNVNAYDDEENIKVTLLEGSVKVNETLIRPGEQAQVSSTIGVTDHINTEAVMAWKNGLFSFDRADIKTVMRQLSRWYNVDIEYTGTVMQHFGGTIDRSSNVSVVLHKLEETGGAHFRVEGNKVIVSP